MNLRMHVIAAVFKRNFLSYFSGVLGYLFIVAFVALGSFLAFTPLFFANNLANLDQLNATFPVLLLFFVPAITMSAWSDERRQGTDELLFTLPVSDLEVLLGKYLAVVGVYTVALLFSLSHVVVLFSLGKPDIGLMLTTYFGYWIIGAALLSAGMVASILTPSATVAYVLGSLLCAIPVFIDRIAPASQLLQGLSISEQFRDFGLGMIPLGGVLYFTLFIALMLYINLVLISRRHWYGGPHEAPMGLHYFVRALALAVALGSTYFATAGVTRRVDMTSEHLFSLTPTTTKVLKGLTAERPVLIQAFISPEVPRDLVSIRTSLVGLLRQFDQQGGNNLQVRIVSTEKFTDAADEARRYGIESQEVQSERAGRFVRDDVFMGVVVSGSVDDQVVIPFFDKGTPIEYELTRSIRTVSEAKRRSVGVLRTDAQIAGGFDMQAFRPLPEWRIISELKKQYEVKQVSPDELASTSVDVLLAVMPSSLTDPEMNSFIDYIKKGNPTLIVDDPFPISQPGLAPRNPKPRPGGGGMFGQQGPGQPKADNGEARRLCDTLGIAWNSGQTVWDRYYEAHPEVRELFAAMQLYDLVYITEANKARHAINPDSKITEGLQELLLFYPGEIKPRENSKLEFVPLLRAGPGSDTYEWEEYVSNSMMGMTALVEPPEKPPARNPQSPVIAARITGSSGKPAANEGGKEAPAADKINVVFVADMDMLSNPFFYVRDKQWQDLRLDNITFILNSIDELAGDDAFLELRTRRPKHRTLTTVESATQTAKKTETAAAAKAEEEAKAALAEAKKRLTDEVEKIRSDKSLDRRTQATRAQMAQENERRRLEVEEASIQNTKKKKTKQIKDQTEREIRTIEDRIRLLAIALPPVPALFLGIFVFAARARDERQGIIPDRLVGKKN